MNWAVGILSAAQSTLRSRCGELLQANGWDPLVHEGTGPDAWRQLVRTLLTTHPDAEGYLLLHDSMGVVPHTREFLESHAWPAGCGAIALCAPRKYVQRHQVLCGDVLRFDFPNLARARQVAKRQRGRVRTIPRPPGLVKLVVRSWRQYRALAFPRETLIQLVDDPQAAIDLGATLRRLRRVLYTVHPALARRIDVPVDPDILSVATDPLRDCIPPYDIQVSGYSDLSEIIRDWAPRLSRDISCIVGVPRSGIIPAAMLALQLHLPLVPIETLLHGGSAYRPDRQAITPRQLRRVTGRPLVLDDTISTGRTVFELRQKIRQPVYYGAIWARPAAKSQVDVWAREHAPNHLWQWNWWATAGAERIACDLDGVLCEDWQGNELREADRYARHLAQARPLFIPRTPVQAIVTSRYERHRAATTDWLQRHGVRYGRLIMEPDTAPRQFADYKARAYDELRGAQLFVESSLSQAQRMFELTGRPVLSIEGFQFFRHQS
ncbi:MAG: phosphoribosyltransferase [Planctomycetaceae bacterium]|nr:phosphoribosyltransferase [Planctomycetaceae bacterium]